MQPVTPVRLRHPLTGDRRTVSDTVADMLRAHGWVDDVPEPVPAEKPKRSRGARTSKPATDNTDPGASPETTPEEA